MPTKCRLLGELVSSAGAPIPLARVTFTPKDGAIRPLPPLTIVPEAETGRTDENGQLLALDGGPFEVYPGVYSIRVKQGLHPAYPTMTGTVPEAETALLSDIQNLTPPVPLNEAQLAVLAAQDARDQAREAAGAAAADAVPAAIAAVDEALSEKVQAAQAAQEAAEGAAGTAAADAVAQAVPGAIAAVDEALAAKVAAAETAREGAETAAAGAVAEVNAVIEEKVTAAEEARSEAAGSAAGATTQAGLAGAAKTAAETARDAAIAAGVVVGTYPSTAEGLAAVAEGATFWAPSGSETLQQYIKTGGAAEPVPGNAMPTAASIARNLDNTLTPLSGYAFALTGQDEGVALGVLPTGEVFMPATPAFNATRQFNAPISGLIWGVTDGDDALGFGLQDDGNLRHKGVAVDLSRLEAAYRLTAPTGIIRCWGDSLTHGNTAGVTTPYPAALAALLPGRTVINRGLSGRTSSQIATAFGAKPSILTVAGNTIPTSGPVSVTITENGNFGSKSSVGSILTTGTLFGIHGTLSVGFNAADPNLPGISTFTRSRPGAALVIPNRTPFIPDTGWENDVSIFWPGRNDIISGFANEVIWENTAAMVAAVTTNPKRFIVLGVTDAASEPAGSAAHSQILACNYELSRRYPGNFIDIRKILVNSYNSSLTADVTAFGNDQIPPSLQQDGLHLNNAGYAIVAQAVANFITAKVW